MRTQMTDEDWTLVLTIFREMRSKRGDKGRNDRRFLEARHYVTVHNITWRALPAALGNWNSVWKRFWRLSDRSRSAATYPVSGLWPGQDGDPRVPGLIKVPAWTAMLRHRLAGHRSTVRPSRVHHPQTFHGAQCRSAPRADPVLRRYRSIGRPARAVTQQRPCDAHQLGRPRHNNRIPVRPGEQAAQPRADRGRCSRQ